MYNYGLYTYGKVQIFVWVANYVLAAIAVIKLIRFTLPAVLRKPAGSNHREDDISLFTRCV